MSHGPDVRHVHFPGTGLESSHRRTVLRGADANNKNKKVATMSRISPSTQDPPAEYPELEATDGGWDPYVTSLLAGAAGQAHPPAGDDDGLPVMSLARVEQRRAR